MESLGLRKSETPVESTVPQKPEMLTLQRVTVWRQC